ncbi:ABC transporter permease [Zavarzinia compransoris]|uniref:ABC transporter permease n=1 Tax=Zavarzinia compransoris TaxID=1264899 RepID=A0A317DYY8_9PROT|nr:ABC transporter permease [Zavarzinia compransoris]PWR19632.1 ABC transporter permease [Zavarzinia compransoris]TDP43427.1 nucleoside ABC transporter membrane protein [Zavarzinia compransoris]
MDEIWGQIFQIGFFAALLRIATPLILASLGEMFAERAGVLNLGIEGIMLLSAMTGFSTAYFTGSLWLGLAAAMATGAAMGVLMGVLTVTLGLSQHVSGIGVTMLCTGFAFFFYRLIFGQPGTPPAITAFTTVPLPLLSDLPFIGPVLFDQFALVYLALVAVPVAAFVLYRTPWGLSLRAVGENPRAADSAGIGVAATRYQALMLSGALMGAAGAFLTMAQFNAFTFGVISGRGWVCIALVVFGQWSPWKCALGALVFALIDTLQLRLQASNAIDVPYQVFLMLPFVLTIVAMALVSRNARAPAALLTPFRKEER